MDYTTVDDCIDAVADTWEDTKQAERWMVCQWQLDDYERLQMNKTHCNFRNGDLYIAVAMLARMIGEERGHSEEYLDAFQNRLLAFVQRTIGRDPAPEPLPLAKHLQNGKDEDEHNQDVD